MFVGVDIGGTKTAVVLSAAMPEVIWREEFPTQPEQGPEHALTRIVDLIRKAMRDSGARSISAIGVSCGGPLDVDRGLIQSPPNLPTWHDVAITHLLESEFGVPCFLENDANAGALAELRYGAGVGCRHMVFLTMGTGLGAGLILNGHIYHGATNMAGEIGHVRLTEDGPIGYGKAGSVEGWASGGGVKLFGTDMVRAAVAAGEPTSLSTLDRPVTARDIGDAMLAGDAVAERIVHQTGRRLGEALAVLVDVLNPQRIVIGGLALRLGDRLLVPARERMRQEALASAADACEIVPAALGERIGDIAALCIATQTPARVEVSAL